MTVKNGSRFRMHLKSAPAGGPEKLEHEMPDQEKAEIKRVISACFQASLRTVQKLADSPEVVDSLFSAVQVISEAYQNGGSLFVAGNGGSAADAQHLVAELVSKFAQDRTPIRAFALTVDTSILTAIGNDYGYEKSFSRQVKGLMRKNDVLLVITTSGESKNILHALDACTEMGAKSILLSGHQGGSAIKKADLSILAPGENTARIQECHLMIYHTLCGLIETELVKRGLCHYV
jgi:D-sedoheptulose 7-phosphate isomerase